VNDAFDPESAAANGVRLGQLLWVRCGTREQGSKPPQRVQSTRWGPRQGAREREKREQGSEAATERRSKEPRVSWTRLDQGLRATDLLLQAGGFAAIVLDLGDTAPEQGIRIPLATWFRYRQAAERTQCSLVVIGRRAYAQSAAGVVLECEAARAATAGENAAGGTVLRGFEFAVRRGRERFAPVEIGTRKPGSPTTGPQEAASCFLGGAMGLHRWGGKPPAATWQADAAWEADRNEYCVNSPHSDRVSPVSKSRPGAPDAVWDAGKMRA
jgi:hypothetical protein